MTCVAALTGLGICEDGALPEKVVGMVGETTEEVTVGVIETVEETFIDEEVKVGGIDAVEEGGVVDLVPGH